MPHRRWPVTWYDDSTGKGYKYGGWAYNSSDWTADLWSYEPGGLTIYWSQEVAPATYGLSFGSNAPWASARAVGISTLYNLGGSIAGGGSLTPNTILSGLVEHFPSSERWSNSTGDVPGSSPYFNQAQAQFAPNFGREGFVIVVGGTNPSGQTFTFEQDASMRDMADIVLYDVSTKKWYVQRATGDIPPPKDRVLYGGKGLIRPEDIRTICTRGYVEYNLRPQLP
ncbi:uncharacterized protein A1O5_12976 [Cladophialophora psammophila CBS 110553]|uniref:Kelch repeat protein n=1 Tax=Cladophialophora psammophila CBS 110553 TaxID=1182543 RepID=W9VDN4_9EURO|nr:uncharacterized protein A1O5_12976 [Cladophialophora psammophila CBS 110553]EXJ53727.1 hypothetical protein A1O5_12976 [Cladophialophora psammophila CBS 110553]